MVFATNISKVNSLIISVFFRKKEVIIFISKIIEDAIIRADDSSGNFISGDLPRISIPVKAIMLNSISSGKWIRPSKTQRKERKAMSFPELMFLLLANII